MEVQRIIDLSEDEMPYDFENTSLILITNITNSTLNNAVTLAESARESGIVTTGIISDISIMKRLLDSADAAIISRGNDESEIIGEISDLITKSGFVNIDIKAITEFLKVPVRCITGLAGGKIQRLRRKRRRECESYTKTLLEAYNNLKLNHKEDGKNEDHENY